MEKFNLTHPHCNPEAHSSPVQAVPPSLCHTAHAPSLRAGLTARCDSMETPALDLLLAASLEQNRALAWVLLAAPILTIQTLSAPSTCSALSKAFPQLFSILCLQPPFLWLSWCFPALNLTPLPVVSAGGLGLCCPAIQDSDLVKIWEASPSQPLAVTTRVSLPLGEAREKCSDPGGSSFSWFSRGRDDPVPCAWALFGWGVFLFTSQPAGKAFLSYSRVLAGLWARWAGCPLQN